jgi:hypothetical protein
MAMQKMSLADFLLQSQGLSPVSKAPESTPPMVGAPLPQGAFPPSPAQPQGFMQRLQRDPSLSLALMNAGIAMMQPTPRGQTHLGHAASGIGAGAQTYIADKDRRFRQSQIEKQTALEERRTKVVEKEGDLRGKADARQEDEFNYSKTRRGYQENLDDLRMEGARVGLDVARIERDLKKTFGAREAEARLDNLLADSAYRRGAGAAGAQKVASKVQEIQSRADTWLQNNPNSTQAEAMKEAWKQEDVARMAQAGAATTNAATAGLKAIYDTLNDPIADPAAKADALQRLGQLTTGGGGTGAPAPQPATGPTWPDGTPVNYNTVRAAYVRTHPNAQEAEIERETQAYLKSVIPGWTPGAQ